MLTDVLTYLRQNQGLTTGNFTAALINNTTYVIDFKAIFSDFTPSATDFKAVLTVYTMISTDFGVARHRNKGGKGGRGIKKRLN